MSPLIKMPKPKLEVADILRHHIAEYRSAYPLAPDQYRIVSHLLHCRTPTLGGHLERCTHCGAQGILYHSCRNRHCPKCQHIPRERWLEKRKSELLPTTYFHIVFTPPNRLNQYVLQRCFGTFWGLRYPIFSDSKDGSTADSITLIFRLIITYEQLPSFFRRLRPSVGFNANLSWSIRCIQLCSVVGLCLRRPPHGYVQHIEEQTQQMPLPDFEVGGQGEDFIVPISQDS